MEALRKTRAFDATRARKVAGGETLPFWERGEAGLAYKEALQTVV